VKFSGDVVERYVYDPYGQVTFYQANWQKTQIGNETPGTLSAYSNAILFGGYYRDAETGLYNVRNRYYHVQLGWLTRDPLGYAGGVNLYEYCGSGPAGATDAMGLRPMGPGDAGYQPGYENLPWKDVDDNPAPRTAKKKPPKGGGEPGGGGKGVGGKPGGVGGGGAGGGGGGGGGDAKEWYNKWWDWENQEGYPAGDCEDSSPGGGGGGTWGPGLTPEQEAYYEEAYGYDRDRGGLGSEGHEVFGFAGAYVAATAPLGGAVACVYEEGTAAVAAGYSQVSATAQTAIGAATAFVNSPGFQRVQGAAIDAANRVQNWAETNPVGQFASGVFEGAQPGPPSFNRKLAHDAGVFVGQRVDEVPGFCADKVNSAYEWAMGAYNSWATSKGSQ